MVLALLASAHGLDPFACEPLTTPAYGRAYADDSLSEDLYARVEALALAQFEEGCPRTCTDADVCYRDDCVTSAGTHLVVEYRRNGAGGDWNIDQYLYVVIEPAGGDLRRLTLSSRYEYAYWYGGVSDSDWTRTWDASWEGTLAPDLAQDEDVSVSYSLSSRYADPYEGEYLHITDTWESEECAWSVRADAVTEMYSDVTPDTTAWSIDVGSQSLGVETVDDCTGLRSADLDDVASAVRADDWGVPVDADGDGADAAVDCDDADPTFAPCALEVACDGLDQDCDWYDDPDGDRDGVDASCAGGNDCDDSDADVHPGAEDVSCDGIDTDCSGDDADGDGDGHDAECAGGDDCDDANYYLRPGASDRVCDGIDTNCDGEDCDSALAEPDPNDAPNAPGGCGGCAGAIALFPLARRRRR